MAKNSAFCLLANVFKHFLLPLLAALLLKKPVFICICNLLSLNQGMKVPSIVYMFIPFRYKVDEEDLH